jgi:hypothetical protein
MKASEPRMRDAARESCGSARGVTSEERTKNGFYGESAGRASAATGAIYRCWGGESRLTKLRTTELSCNK